MPLSQSLPLRKESFKGKECRAFFAGILPEESKREIIARNLGIGARNDYAMLDRSAANAPAPSPSFPRAGRSRSSEKIMSRDFEPLAEEAGLGKAQVKRRVPELAAKVTDVLGKIEIVNPTTEKVGALIRERCEKALNNFKN